MGCSDTRIYTLGIRSLGSREVTKQDLNCSCSCSNSAISYHMMVNVPASCNSCSRQHYRPATAATAAAPATLPSSCITMAAVSSACRDNVMSLGTEHVDVLHCCASDRTKARHSAVYRKYAGGKCRMKISTRAAINEHGKKAKNINLHLYNTIARPASAFNHQMLNIAASRWTKAGNKEYNYSSVQEHGEQGEAVDATFLLNVGHIHLLDNSLQTAAFSINTYDEALTYNNNNNQDGDSFTRNSRRNILHGFPSPPTAINLNLHLNTEASPAPNTNKTYPELRTGHYTCISGRNGHYYHGHNQCNLSRKHRQYGTQDREERRLSRDERATRSANKRIITLSKHRYRRRLADLRMLLTFMCLNLLFPFPVITATTAKTPGKYSFLILRTFNRAVAKGAWDWGRAPFSTKKFRKWVT